MRVADYLRQTLPPYTYGFAYGSGVFEQQGLYDPNEPGPMVDVILAVADPEEWHAQVRSRACFIMPAAAAAQPSMNWGLDVTPLIATVL